MNLIENFSKFVCAVSEKKAKQFSDFQVAFQLQFPCVHFTLFVTFSKWRHHYAFCTEGIPKYICFNLLHNAFETPNLKTFSHETIDESKGLQRNSNPQPLSL